jgi:hypothetical protein
VFFSSQRQVSAACIKEAGCRCDFFEDLYPSLLDHIQAITATAPDIAAAPVNFGKTSGSNSGPKHALRALLARLKHPGVHHAMINRAVKINRSAGSECF